MDKDIKASESVHSKSKSGSASGSGGAFNRGYKTLNDLKRENKHLISDKSNKSGSMKFAEGGDGDVVDKNKLCFCCQPHFQIGAFVKIFVFFFRAAEDFFNHIMNIPD